VRTLLERLEPKQLLEEIQTDRVRRVKLIDQWDSALLTLKELGWEVVFDQTTYPESIRPTWARVDEADSNYRPRNWLAIWLKGIIVIKPSVKIQERLGGSVPPTLKSSSGQRSSLLTGEMIQAALDTKGMTKAQLADTLQVDRSLVTRWLKGQRTIQPKHCAQIITLLDIS
jgi:Helix-turn-helix